MSIEPPAAAGPLPLAEQMTGEVLGRYREYVDQAIALADTGEGAGVGDKDEARGATVSAAWGLVELALATGTPESTRPGLLEKGGEYLDVALDDLSLRGNEWLGAALLDVSWEMLTSRALNGRQPSQEDMADAYRVLVRLGDEVIDAEIGRWQGGSDDPLCFGGETDRQAAIRGIAVYGLLLAAGHEVYPASVRERDGRRPRGSPRLAHHLYCVERVEGGVRKVPISVNKRRKHAQSPVTQLHWSGVVVRAISTGVGLPDIAAGGRSRGDKWDMVGEAVLRQMIRDAKTGSRSELVRGVMDAVGLVLKERVEAVGGQG